MLGRWGDVFKKQVYRALVLSINTDVWDRDFFLQVSLKNLKENANAYKNQCCRAEIIYFRHRLLFWLHLFPLLRLRLQPQPCIATLKKENLLKHFLVPQHRNNTTKVISSESEVFLSDGLYSSWAYHPPNWKHYSKITKILTKKIISAQELRSRSRNSWLRLRFRLKLLKTISASPASQHW